tara:strand:- start:1642 stop:1980 length:339 start_codon:yes stop_codon:yes gene_type:complete
MGKEEDIENLRKHKEALEIIVDNPEKFDLKGEGIKQIHVEQPLFDEKNILVEPDIVFEYDNGELYIIEYKDNGKHYNMARRQLTRAAWWYGRYRKDISPRNIHTRIIQASDI